MILLGELQREGKSPAVRGGNKRTVADCLLLSSLFCSEAPWNVLSTIKSSPALKTWKQGTFQTEKLENQKELFIHSVVHCILCYTVYNGML